MMAFNGLEKEDIVELLEQARFELSRQKKEQAFQKDILAEYETEVAHLHNRNRELEDELKRIEKDRARLQLDHFVASVHEEGDDDVDSSSEPGASGHSSDEGLDDGSCSVSSDRGCTPSLHQFTRCKSESALPKRRSQTIRLPTRSPVSDTSERYSPAQLNLFVSRSGCTRCRSNDVERDELLDEIHELVDQITECGKINTKLLAERNQQAREITELTAELFSLKTAYGELENEVERLQYEKTLFERDAADVSELRATLSLERPSAEIVREFSTGSSIGDELGLTGRHVNFGEYAEKYREIAENVNWDALLEVDETPDSEDHLTNNQVQWADISLNQSTESNHAGLIRPELFPVALSRSISLAQPIIYKSSEDIGETFELSMRPLSTGTPLPEDDNVQDDSMEEIRIETRNGMDRTTSKLNATQVNDDTAVDSESESDATPGKSQGFSGWAKSLECFVPWHTSMLSCCRRPKVDKTRSGIIKPQTEYGFLGKLFRRGSSGRSLNTGSKR